MNGDGTVRVSCGDGGEDDEGFKGGCGWLQMARRKLGSVSNIKCGCVGDPPHSAFCHD